MSLIREMETIENGFEDVANSSSTPLGAGGVFLGAWFDTLNYNVMLLGVMSDQASATDGLDVEWSADGITETQDDRFTIAANSGKVFTFSPANRYVRIRYTNGATPQGSFSLQLIHKKGGFKASSHRLGDSLVADDDATAVKAVLTAQDLTGVFSNIGQFRGALNVHNSDVHQKLVNSHFTTDLVNTTTVTPASLSGDTIINVADTTGFLVGSTITITNGPVQEINGAVVTIVGAGAPGTLTLDRPLDNAYSIGSTVSLVDENLASLVGTLAAPISYRMGPPAGEIWHIMRILVSATFGTAADDNRLGNIAGGVINGLVLRKNLSTGLETLTNWKKNADMKRDMYDLTYTDRAGGTSVYGMNSRWTFKAVDYVPELIGDNGDFMEFLVQDDITALDTFEVHAQGHKVGL